MIAGSWATASRRASAWARRAWRAPTASATAGQRPHARAKRASSTAIRTGVKAARGQWIATLDGDGQNDPADIPKLLAQRAQS